jgi:hypothetical protein
MSKKTGITGQVLPSTRQFEDETVYIIGNHPGEEYEPLAAFHDGFCDYLLTMDGDIREFEGEDEFECDGFILVVTEAEFVSVREEIRHNVELSIKLPNFTGKVSVGYATEISVLADFEEFALEDLREDFEEVFPFVNIPKGTEYEFIKN